MKHKHFKLNVLSHDIDVTIEDPGMWARDGLGRSCLRDQKICLNERMPADGKFTTLFHEAIHFGADILSVEMSEQQIDCAALTVFSLLKDNPDLVAELVAAYRFLTLSECDAVSESDASSITRDP